mmetsp:Transcript_32364/g.58784  ORF Transcript_32364/g.58784 Transcript_32364/m.58784 type:complete len:1082 (-) Transcript_32364:8-3253(-)
MDWYGERGNYDRWNGMPSTPRGPLAVAGAGNVAGPPAALQKRGRPQVWQDSPAFPEPNARPVWANGRGMPPPVSVVEAVFRDKYYASSLPAPLDMSELDDVRLMLAKEPGPGWVAPAQKTFRDTCGCADCGGCGGGKPVRARKPPNGASRPATRGAGYGPGRGSPALQIAASAAVSEGRPHTARDAAAIERAATANQKTSAAPPWIGQVDDNHTSGGVHLDIAPGLAERLRRLVSSTPSSNVYAWIIIESCRDCAHHDATLRHDETQYVARFNQVKEAFEQRFPRGVAVELLVTSSESEFDSAPFLPGEGNAQRKGREPTYRIGSFEVYLCSEAPLKPYGAAPLVVRRGGAGAASFNGVCLSSKLRTRSWPSVEAVLKRASMSMPQLPVHVTVRTTLDFPLPGVQLSASGPENNQVAASETDVDGVGMIGLPMFTPMTVKAWRPALMECQEVLVEVVAPDTHLNFTTDTVVQLWQMETAKELVVFCSSPRMSGRSPGQTDGLVPFQGQLECESGETALRGDSAGYLRSREDPLADADLVACTGWRSCPISEAARQVHGTGKMVEIGRLGVPIAEVSLITRCCCSAVPGARITVDGENFGTTDDSGEPMSCGVRTGEHTLVAEHMLLSPQGLCVPLVISGSTTCGVQVELPLDRLRFVCSGAPGARSQGRGASADLWLVGGDLAQWRCSRGAPPMDAEVWLWDGELRPTSPAGVSPRPLQVQAGVLARNALAGAQRMPQADDQGDHEDAEPDNLDGAETRRPSGSGRCILSDALAAPSSSLGPWQVVLHAAAPPSGQECAVTRLARLASGAAPALWLARLVAEGNDSPATSTVKPRLAVRTTCCATGMAGVRVSLNGEEAGTTDEEGELELRSACDKCNIGLEGVPACLLPGGASEFVAHFGAQQDRVELETACLIWVYWVPPDEPEEPDPDWEDEDVPVDEEGILFVCTNGDQVPDEARPIIGVLRCPGSEDAEISLDGRSMGPFLLRPARSHIVGESPCLLSQVTFDAVAPHGYTYRAKNPSPLAERHEELGGCEMQRLMAVPVGMGFLKRLTALTSPVSPNQAYSDDYNDDADHELGYN